tara:strand:+ start:2883 stop:3203 length:321 start_codon:yes stop_codon:yes gene_type:complete
VISTNISILSLCIAVLSTALGQLFFRMYFLKTQKRYIYSAFASFVIVPLLNFLALKNLTITVVYMSTAVTHILVLLFSFVSLKEKLSMNQGISVTLIISGIIIFNQ